MRYNGQINDWNDDRGFGFVLISGSGARHFVHIKSFDTHQQRPKNGDWVTFELAPQRGREARAERVRYASQRGDVSRTTQRNGGRRFVIDWVLAGVWCAALGASVVFDLLPRSALAVVAAGALVAFVMYNLDKRRAERNERRTPEGNLLAVSAVGWPGALAAQQLFRHKSAKRSFYYSFRAIALCELGAVGWLAHLHGLI